MYRLLGLGAGIPLFRVRGVQIELHWSVLVVVIWLPIVVVGIYGTWLPDLSTNALTAMALASVVLLEVSIVLHELGHAFQGRREGLVADRVILWAFGGIAFISGPRRSPGSDFRVTAAGPAVTLALAAIFCPLALLADSAGWADWVLGLLAFMGVGNVGLFLFNLLPIFPLDGGRMLHAALWRLRGYSSASIWTTRIGLAVAGAMLAVGILAPFVADLHPRVAFSVMFNAVLLLTVTYTVRPPEQAVAPALRGRQVGDLLRPTPVTPAPDALVESFLECLTREGGQSAAAYPVIDDGRVVGVISPGIAAEALADGRTVGEAMISKEDAVVLTPEMSIDQAYAALGDDPTRRAIVVAEDQVVGILQRSDLADALLTAREARHGSIVPATPARLRVDW